MLLLNCSIVYIVFNPITLKVTVIKLQKKYIAKHYTQHWFLIMNRFYYVI